MLTQRKSQEFKEATQLTHEELLKQRVFDLENRVLKLEAALQEMQDKDLKVKPAHGHGMFDR